MDATINGVPVCAQYYGYEGYVTLRLDSKRSGVSFAIAFDPSQAHLAEESHAVRLGHFGFVDRQQGLIVDRDDQFIPGLAASTFNRIVLMGRELRRQYPPIRPLFGVFHTPAIDVTAFYG